MNHQVDIVRTPARAAAVTRFHVAHGDLPTIGDQMEGAFAMVMNRLAAVHVIPAGPAVAVYRPSGDGFDVSTGFHVAPQFVVPSGLEALNLAAVDAAHTTHVGPYAGLRAAYADVETEAARAGRPVAWGVPIWEEYWSEPGTPDDETRTEIYWPVAA